MSKMFVRLIAASTLSIAAVGPANGWAAPIVSSRTEAVEETIRQIPDLGPHSISIETHQGFVKLTGTVNSAEDRSRIESRVRGIPETTSIKNELTIKEVVPPAAAARSRQIAREIRDQIEADHSIGGYSIDILPSGETLALVGTVAQERDRGIIEQIARKAAGVVTVDNRLTAAPAESDEVVELNVRTALKNAGDVDLTGLGIAANGGLVTFTGARNNHRDIDRILGVALMVPGVREIKSNMTITPKR